MKIIDMSEELEFTRQPTPTPPPANLQPLHPWTPPESTGHGADFTAHAESYIDQYGGMPNTYPDYSGMGAKQNQAKSLKDKFTSFFGH